MKHLFFSFLLVIGNYSHGQNCSEKLQEATRAFYQGNLREVNPLIENCVIGELQRSELTEALKLLVNTQLLLNKNDQADVYMLQLLKEDPSYELRSGDLAEFKSLYNSYEIKPSFSVGVSGGLLIPDYQITQPQSFFSRTVEPNDYNENPGFFLGISGNYHLYKNLFFSAGVFYEKKSFNQSEIVLDFQEVSSHERQFRINVPLTARYVFKSNSIKPFVELGYGVQYLIKSSGNIDRIPLASELQFPILDEPVSSIDQKLTHVLNRWGYNLISGAGVFKQVRNGLIQLNIRYEFGLKNLVNTDKINSADDLYAELGYIPDNVETNTLSVSIGYFYSFYQPKKKRS